MFDGPEHASYIALCRELRLERRGQPGDWFRRALVDKPMGFIYDYMITDVDGRMGYGPAPSPRNHSMEVIWLPLLHQWLAMILAAERLDQGVTIRRYDDGTFWAGEVDYVEGERYLFPSDSIGGTDSWPTPEEAAARLWMAVTGRAVRV